MRNKDKRVGTRGSNLSGGERQRICLARALASRNDILILDEVTSSIDTQSERVITNFLNGLPSSFTVIVITHKLETIKNSERIFYINEGRFREIKDYREVINFTNLTKDAPNHY